ncbi:hypothetical protein FGRMN_6846 [Fusarium graminum]|nr:hypothetical protein FGRMN_6846 [Fusarium graminum]
MCLSCDNGCSKVNQAESSDTLPRHYTIDRMSLRGVYTAPYLTCKSVVRLLKWMTLRCEYQRSTRETKLNADKPVSEEFFANQWQGIVEKCAESLESHDWEELPDLNAWTAVESVVNRELNDEYALVKPALSHLDAFTAIFHRDLGPVLDTSFFWGVIGIALKISAEIPRSPRTIQRLLKTIGYRVDSFNTFWSATPTVMSQMKEACFDIQVQLLEFFIDVIRCLRGDPELAPPTRFDNDPSQAMRARFVSTDEDLDEILTRVEKLTRFGMPLAFHNQSRSRATAPKTSHYVLPQTRTLPGRFFNRLDVFDKLDNVLPNDQTRSTFRAATLWGVGGIGKSSIAMRYVDIKVEKKTYDAIFWVHGQKRLSLLQSFTEIAMKLKLPDATPQGHEENLELVQEWFQSTDDSWLVIYDNVVEKKVLQPFWPSSSHGHAMMTTRNPTLALDFASTGIEIASWNAQTGSEFLLFLLKKEIGKDLTREGISAYELSKRLSGHAMGLTHMAGLIHHRSVSVTEFIELYMSDPRRIHNDDESELQTLLDFSFKSLDPESCSLLGVLAFLTPDDIPQKLFEMQKEDLPKHLQFCSDRVSRDRYLFEVNLLDDLEMMCQVNLTAVKTLEDKNVATEVHASTLTHLAQMYETLGDSKRAVELNEESLDLRFTERPLRLYLISSTQNNLGFTYDTANEHEKALTMLERSLATLNKAMKKEGKTSTRDAVITANTARSLFYHKRFEEAREHVEAAIQEFKTEVQLNWGGLAYATFVLGIIDMEEKNLEAAEAHFIEAQNIWLLGDHTRSHPFNAACMYKTGVCCLEQGKVEAAVKHLGESMEVTKKHKLRRAMDPNETARCDELLSEAKELFEKAKPGETFKGTEASFNESICISWR